MVVRRLGNTTIFLGRTLLYQSIASIGAIRASMLLRLHPFFSVLLAALILGETVGAAAAGGMLLIMLSFALLLRRAFGQRPPAARGIAAEGPASPLDYLYGPASAFSYALGNIARKHALGLVPDASFGTLVSALTGIVSFAVALLRCSSSAIATRSRACSRMPADGKFAAGLFASAGQLSNFAAIQHIEVSRAVMITSAEIFLSMFLAVYVLKTEKRPDAVMLAAAALAMIGVVLVAAG